MPLTSEDFHVENAGPLDLLKLDLALHYIQTQMPLNGAPIIEALNRDFVSIIINHEGKNRRSG